MSLLRSLQIDIALIVAGTPLLARHLSDLAGREQYQFALVFLPLIFGIAIWRSRSGAWQVTAAGPLNFLLRALSIGSTVGALLIFDPWLGFVGSWLAVGSLAIRARTTDRTRPFVFPWLAALITLPPPLGLDQSLVLLLQSIAAGLSGEMLDYLQVVHVREGNTFEIAGQKLLVEEACSGVNSLYSTVALCLLIVQIQQFGRAHLIWLTLYGVAADLAANAARIVAIVMGRTNFDLDLLSEPNHSRLGVGMFMVVLLLLASFSKLLDAFLLPFFEDFWEGTTHGEKPKLSSRWRARVLGKKRRTKPAGVVTSVPLSRIRAAEAAISTSETTDTAAIRRPAVSSAGAVDVPGEARSRGARRGIKRAAVAWSFAAAISLLQVALLIAAERRSIRFESSSRESIAAALEGLQERSFAEQCPGWDELTFETVERSSGSIFGERSRVWTFGRERNAFTLSCDYPFGAYHRLQRCYRGIGWEVREIEAFESPDGEERVRLSLERPGGEVGLVIFTLIDVETGRSLPTPTAADMVATRLIRAFRANPLWADDTVSPDSVTSVQLQMLIEGTEWPTALEREMYESTFERLLDRVRQTVLARSRGDTAASGD